LSRHATTKSKFVATLLDALHARGFKPKTAALDKGYDNARVYAECEERGRMSRSPWIFGDGGPGVID
jgi:hypothetical protein